MKRTILLDTDLKIILLDLQNNFVGILKISSAAKNFDILATSLIVLHNYFKKFWNLHKNSEKLYEEF